MIYEQILSAKGTTLEKVKRGFQIVGLIHFLTAFIAFMFLIFIYWKWALLTLIWFSLGFVYGSVAYCFSFDYKYFYKNGEFTVYKLNAYNKYIKKLSITVNVLQIVEKQKAISLTNINNKIYIKCNNMVYAISPDDYMLSLIKSGAKEE